MRGGERVRGRTRGLYNSTAEFFDLISWFVFSSGHDRDCCTTVSFFLLYCNRCFDMLQAVHDLNRLITGKFSVRKGLWNESPVLGAS